MGGGVNGACGGLHSWNGKAGGLGNGSVQSVAGSSKVLCVVRVLGCLTHTHQDPNIVVRLFTVHAKVCG